MADWLASLQRGKHRGGELIVAEAGFKPLVDLQRKLRRVAEVFCDEVGRLGKQLAQLSLRNPIVGLLVVVRMGPGESNQRQAHQAHEEFFDSHQGSYTSEAAETIS